VEVEVYSNFGEAAVAAAAAVVVAVVVAAVAVGDVCGSAAAAGRTGGLVEGPTWVVEWWEGVASFEQIGHSWADKVHQTLNTVLDVVRNDAQVIISIINPIQQ
jgi:hypothetical protein